MAHGYASIHLSPHAISLEEFSVTLLLLMGNYCLSSHCNYYVSTDSAFFIDPRERTIGVANTRSTSRLLGTLALFPFSSRLQMSFEEIEVLLAHARADAANTSLKPYFPLQVLELITFFMLS